MVTHIVMFRLKDKSSKNIEKARDILLSMDGKITELKSIEVGIDFLRSERSYDLVLITKFNSRQDLDKYQDHPYHVDVVKKHMHEVIESSMAVDYET
ncbi:MAG TPA: Dabb family protein [Clostridia bacterium]